MSIFKQLDKRDIVVRIGGDSGDGIQLIGKQLATMLAQQGASVLTIADFPAEIRAPKGTIGGVSGFQFCFSKNSEVLTSGDDVDIMVALNPASLGKSIDRLQSEALIIYDSDTFIEKNFDKAGMSPDMLAHSDKKQAVGIPLTTLCQASLEPLVISKKITKKDADHSRNIFLLGILSYLFQIPEELGSSWIKAKFRQQEIWERNQLAFAAGWQHAKSQYPHEKGHVVSNDSSTTNTEMRYVTGNQATALGLLAAGVHSQKGLLFASYPITPASEIFHELAKFKELPITTFQAEDEIAAIGAALGASYGGRLGATASSGPGISLKTEFMGLAVMAELPLVIINVQRAGPSTGMPTKTAQGDLMQALFGRHGEAPLVVVAPSSPRDCFAKAYWAARIAAKYMTPVILLSDSFLANSSEVWQIPPIEQLEDFEISGFDPEKQPYSRLASTGSRPWIVPGTVGGEHAIGGLEKKPESGQVSYHPEDHQQMTLERQQKIMNVAQEYPPSIPFGDQNGGTLLVTWGSSFGVGRETVQDLFAAKFSIAHLHLDYLCPLPQDLHGVFERYKNIVIAESNEGQLSKWLTMNYSRNFISIHESTGMPFTTDAMKSKLLRQVETL